MTEETNNTAGLALGMSHDKVMSGDEIAAALLLLCAIQSSRYQKPENPEKLKRRKKRK
jgi:hypothetical protein